MGIVGLGMVLLLLLLLDIVAGITVGQLLSRSFVLVELGRAYGPGGKIGH